MEKFLGFVAGAVFVAMCVHALRDEFAPTSTAGPIAAPMATPAPTTQADEEPPTATWTTVDLHDIVVDFPGQATARTSLETTQHGSMTANWREVKRGQQLHVWARTLDPLLAPAPWNGTAAVDMAAEFGIAALRKAAVGTLRVAKNERRYVAGMVGRAIEVHIAPTAPDEPNFTLRSIYLSRTNRIYDVTVASVDRYPDADNDAVAVMRSVRLGPRATVGRQTPTAAAPAMPAPMTDAELEAAIARTEALANGSVGTITPQPQPQVVDPVGYGDGSGYGVGSNPVPAYHGPVHVNGYVRRDGTYVQPHTRSAPRR